MSLLNFDRYHVVMAEFIERALLRKFNLDSDDNNTHASFYVTQRNLPFTFVTGHSALHAALTNGGLDHERLTWLLKDKAGLRVVAQMLSRPNYPGEVWMVHPGTVVFAQEPIVTTHGPFAETQLGEVTFEHVLDDRLTFAYKALAIKLATAQVENLTGLALLEQLDLNRKNSTRNLPWLSDFSLRRHGNPQAALLAAEMAFIGGWDDTSNLEAGFQLGIPTIGTQAHYLLQYAVGLVKLLKQRGKITELLDENNQPKHPQRLMFEDWLDCFPKGTTLLVDTFGLELGMRHAVEAALSKPHRREAMKFVRIDSGDLMAGALFARKMLDANSLNQVGIILTGDLDADKIRQIMQVQEKLGIWLAAGFGVGTRYAVGNCAGVIFKMIEACGVPVCKFSASSGKATLPGQLQIYRFYNQAGLFTRDVIGLVGEHVSTQKGEVGAHELLHPFYHSAKSDRPYDYSPQDLRRVVWSQIAHFAVSLAVYAKERIQTSEGVQALLQYNRQWLKDANPTKIVIPVTLEKCERQVKRFS